MSVQTSRRYVVEALFLGLGVLLTPTDAWAYVDPGTGSYLFQLAAAGLLAGIYTMRSYWRALAATFRGRGASESMPNASDPGRNDLD